MHVDSIIAQGAGGIVEIIWMHHQAAWKNTDSALKNAHVYVHFKAVYTLALKQGLSKGDGCHIGRAQKLFHGTDVVGRARLVEPRKRGCDGIGPDGKQTA